MVRLNCEVSPIDVIMELFLPLTLLQVLLCPTESSVSQLHSEFKMCRQLDAPVHLP